MNFSRLRFFVLALLLAAAAQAQTAQPVAGAAIPAQSLTSSGGAAAIDLRNHFSVPGISGQVVQFDTVAGRLNVELRSDVAPRHAANFLAYVQANAYTGTFFHRSAALEAGAVSIIQGGGYRSSSTGGISEVTKLAPVALEYNLPNARGTLAAARTSDINSATSEWYFNVRDNSNVLGQSNGGGYTVFGRVLGNGMTVIDAIAALPRVNAGAPFTDLPVRNLVGTNVSAANLIIVNSITTASIFPTGSGASVVTFSAASSNPSVATAALSGSTLTLTPVGGGTASITVTATDTSGSTAAQSVAVTVSGPSASRLPVITAQPRPEILLPSGTSNTVVFTVAATATPAPTYQWRRNGVAVTGQTSATYVLTNASDAQAGRFTCLVSNSEGSTESQPSVVSFIAAAPADRGRLVNLAIRTNAGTGAQTLIVGFSLGGAGTTGSTPLLVRGMGPSLTQFGLTGVLPDPVATMVRRGSPFAENDNWGGATAVADRASQVGAFAFASTSSLDAALAVTPGADSYTVQITDRNNRTGIALAEIYDAVNRTAFTASTPRLVNVSARTEVGAGSDILIAGFAIGGTTAKTVLIRAIGPALAVFGVTDTLADPRLQLYAGSNLVAENDNWGGDLGLVSVGDSVGAFRLGSTSSGDAMLLVSLPPGSYTAQISGANSGTGVALVEVYEVP
jgi:cyclophilin family peptidyl-prolyl cis-trans isomerase